MDKDDVREVVLRILGDIVPQVSQLVVNPDMSFHDQLELDSIDFLRLMMELEKELGITIFDFDYPRLSTLRGCENYLAERLFALQVNLEADAVAT